MSICMLSFDVEDWFHVENLRGFAPRNTWNDKESRVAGNIDQLLKILDETKTKATFFVLGWIAERRPQLVKKISDAGHEIASHGYEHELTYNQSTKLFRQDIRRSKQILENITGKRVIGYRAPSFSISQRIIEVLIEEEFLYDSSFFPSCVHDRYGSIDSLSVIETEGVYQLGREFYEIIISTLKIFRQHLPWGGGGYFRVLPYPVFQWGIRRILRRQGIYSFYLHPWELDAQQPRARGIGMLYRLRHYAGLSSTKRKLQRLLNDFRFITIKRGLKGLGRMPTHT
jgi:polysaccharide deacetylase family protein (PEP-CTERM system associated)